MSELQNVNDEVLTGEVTELEPMEETKDESLGKLGIALIGLAAIGTVAVGKAVYKGRKKLVGLIRDKITDARGDVCDFEDDEADLDTNAEPETEEEAKKESEKK